MEIAKSNIIDTKLTPLSGVIALFKELCSGGNEVKEQLFHQ